MVNKMKKLSVLAFSSDLGRIMKDFLWLSTIQVSKQDIDISDNNLVKKLDVTYEKSALEKDYQKIESVYKSLCKYRTDYKKISPNVINANDLCINNPVVEKASKVACDGEKSLGTISQCELKVKELKSKLDLLSQWFSYDLELGNTGTKNAKIVLGSFPASIKLDKVIFDIDNLVDSMFEFEKISNDSLSNYVSIIIPRNKEREVDALLSSYSFIPAAFEKEFGYAKDENDKVSKQITELENKIEKEKANLVEYAKSCREMEIALDIISNEIKLAESKENILTTDKVVNIVGWVPEKRIEKVEKILSNYVCAYEFEDPKEDDEVPVLLQNSKLITPFEAAVGLYSYPKYGTFDPTFWVAIFFSIFFGLMNADAGYGLLLLIGCIVLKKKLNAKGTMRKFLDMFAVSSIACIVAGVLFGGYFGNAPEEILNNVFGVSLPEGFHFYILFDPMKEPIVFFIMSLALGAVHLLTGLAIKMYILIKNGEIFSAIFDVGSWFVLFGGAGLYFVIGTPGLVVAIIGVAMIILTHGRDKKNIFMKLATGVLGLYDLVNYLSDVLSYSRVMALGLSSTVIAQVFNILSTIAGKSPMTLLLFPIVFTLGHALNMALGLLGGFVHSARLQYIEFFGKFFEPGGNEFKPLSPNTKYSEIEIKNN